MLLLALGNFRATKNLVICMVELVARVSSRAQSACRARAKIFTYSRLPCRAFPCHSSSFWSYQSCWKSQLEVSFDVLHVGLVITLSTSNAAVQTTNERSRTWPTKEGHSRMECQSFGYVRYEWSQRGEPCFNHWHGGHFSETHMWWPPDMCLLLLGFGVSRRHEVLLSRCQSQSVHQMCTRRKHCHYSTGDQCIDWEVSSWHEDADGHSLLPLWGVLKWR